METALPLSVDAPSSTVQREVRTLRVFIGLLALACLALCVLVTLLAQQNRQLKSDLQSTRTARVPESLAVGKPMSPISTRDKSGTPLPLSFGNDQPATLLLVVSNGCEHCEKMLPVYDEIITKAANSKLRVVAIVTDANGPKDLKPMPTSITPFSAVEGKTTWLRDVPIVPAAFLVNTQGVITHEWLGELGDSQADRDAVLFALMGAE